MLRKESEAVSEGNGPVPQQEELGSGQPTMEEICWVIKKPLEVCNRSFDKVEEYIEERRSIDQRLIRLEYNARQPRFAMEADGPANTKTRERTEGDATAVQAMHGDNCIVQKVQDEPKTSISFDVKTEPPDLPCKDDVLVKDAAAAPKSCLPSLEMLTTAAAGGLVPTGKTSTATETTSNEPLLRLYSVMETDFKKRPTPYVSYDNSVFQKSNLPAAPYCRRVVETKSRHNRTFDPGDSQGHLRACPLLESWCALVCGEVMHAGAAGDELQRFSGGNPLALLKQGRFWKCRARIKVAPSRAA